MSQYGDCIVIPVRRTSLTPTVRWRNGPVPSGRAWCAAVWEASGDDVKPGKPLKPWRTCRPPLGSAIRAQARRRLRIARLTKVRTALRRPSLDEVALRASTIGAETRPGRAGLGAGNLQVAGIHLGPLIPTPWERRLPLAALQSQNSDRGSLLYKGCA
jgi:hypothetical protein